jgi:hypothetical protein
MFYRTFRRIIYSIALSEHMIPPMGTGVMVPKYNLKVEIFLAERQGAENEQPQKP